DIQLAALAHLGGTSVTEMRIVGPDDDLGDLTLPTQVGRQRLDGLDHVGVAKIPRRLPPAEHRSIILLGVLYQPGVLLGVEEACAVRLTQICHPTPLQLHQLLDRLVLARSRQVEARSITVSLAVLTELL